MSFGAGLFRIRAMIGRPPIMSFDFGGLKIYEEFMMLFLIQTYEILGLVFMD